VVSVVTRDYAAALCEAGRRAGLDRVAVASAEPFADTRAILEERAAAGLSGSMQFTYRNPARSTDVSQALPGARALVVAALAYPGEATAPTDRRADRRASPGPHGRVARYAAADHYGRLRRGLELIAATLRDDGWGARVLVDDNALVDRAAAERAGLGWFGRNANILVPGLGSWVVLGSVVTDAPLPASDQRVPDGCGSCTRCIDLCPTGAIVAPGVVDANRCLAWLVQAEGVFPVDHRVALGDRLYGCDECQEVCPPSRRFARDGGAGETAVDLVELLGLDDDELLARFGRWYIPRRDPRYLRRNALVALANASPDEVEPARERVRAAVASALASPDGLVRAHAVWAARRLGLTDLVEGVELDPDGLVRAELDRP
jgi:epoxyqueuosine reductase